jgi:hypothetical protein
MFFSEVQSNGMVWHLLLLAWVGIAFQIMFYKNFIFNYSLSCFVNIDDVLIATLSPLSYIYRKNIDNHLLTTNILFYSIIPSMHP